MSLDPGKAEAHTITHFPAILPIVLFGGAAMTTTTTTMMMMRMGVESADVRPRLVLKLVTGSAGSRGGAVNVYLGGDEGGRG